MTAATAAAETPVAEGPWQETVARARGQTVYWNAWGGDEKINAYIGWVAEQVDERYGIDLQHVKVADIATVVSRILTEKAAGRDTDGSVDLMWINGENFLTMKENDLLFGPFTQSLPNMALADTENKPTLLVDFTVPVDGLEAPWGMAQFVFMYDSARVARPPTTLDGLRDWIRSNPGRFTYPEPPNFIGSTFLKHLLHHSLDDPERLQEPVDAATFDADTAGVWDWLDATHPLMWRAGRTFPANGPALQTLLDDGEVDFAMSFHPAAASSAIDQGLLPDTVRTFVLDTGTIANTHFVAIPYNATHKAGAMVVANFLLSPVAQARKQDPRHWGDDTVLGLHKLDPADRALFTDLPLGVATLPPADRGTPLPEPHPSWMTELEAAWKARYAR